MHIVEYFNILISLKVNRGIRVKENVQGVFRKLFCFYFLPGLPDGFTRFSIYQKEV